MIFELFALNYQYWQYNKTEQELNAAKMLWLSNLKHVSLERCDEAANRAIKIYKAPPAISEFLALIRVEPAHQDFPKRLPPPEPNKSIQQREIAKMREVLRENNL